MADVKPKALEAAGKQLRSVCGKIDQIFAQCDPPAPREWVELYEREVKTIIDAADLDVSRVDYDSVVKTLERTERERDEGRRQLQEMIEERDHLLDELTEVYLKAEALFDAIVHGDDEHRRWLKEAIDNYFAGKPVPEPTGLGRAEKAEAECDEAHRDMNVLGEKYHEALAQLVALREAAMPFAHAFSQIKDGDTVVATLAGLRVTARESRYLGDVISDTTAGAAQYQLVDDEHVVVPIEPTRERLERGLEGTDPAFRERDIEIRRHIYLITTATTKSEPEDR